MSEELKLYEIAASIQNILGEEEWTEETELRLAALEMSLETKADNITSLVQKLESFAEMCKNEEKRIGDKRKTAENRIRNLKDYLLRAMIAVDRTEIVAGTRKICIQNNPPSVVVDNEEMIPAHFYTIVPQTLQLDKKLLAAALKTGEVPGAHLEAGKSLRVK